MFCWYSKHVLSIYTCTDKTLALYLYLYKLFTLCSPCNIKDGHPLLYYLAMVEGNIGNLVSFLVGQQKKDLLATVDLVHSYPLYILLE